jgi:hypothetical protein
VFRVGGGGGGSSALIPTPAASYAVQARCSGAIFRAFLNADTRLQSKARAGFTAASLKDIRHANSFAAR